jgi:glutamine amidotransferase
VIAVVDYGLGNLGSVIKGFRRVGAETELTGDPERLSHAEALVLPGDGAFGTAMAELRRCGLVQPLLDAVASGTPLLGICVGMQLLFERGEEHGDHVGLGLLPGRVKELAGPAFEGPERLALPHMGWNRLRPRLPHPLLDGLGDEAFVYFVHSYVCEALPEHVLATTDYGGEVAAIVGRDHVVGMQFHPEKSQQVGLALVARFVDFVTNRERKPRAVEAHS